MQECLAALQAEKEKKITCRFPCRVIYVRSRNAYRELCDALKGVCDRVAPVDVLVPSADVMPQYDNLIEHLRPGEWMLLPGVSEYLRLFHKSEAKSGRFAKLWRKMVDAGNTGRFIIPVWNCEALWSDPALGLCSDERQDDYVYKIEDSHETPEKSNILVFSAVFEEYITQLAKEYALIVGLQEWYERLINTEVMPEDYCLITKQVRSIEPVVGDITIRLIRDTYSFVKESLSDGGKLEPTYCSEEMLGLLIPEAVKGVTLNAAILNCFNVLAFDGLSIMSSWNMMPTGKRQLLRMWYRLNPDTSYICHVITASDDDTLSAHVLLDVFDGMKIHPEWVEESILLMAALKLPKTAEFFTKLDQIPAYEDRLSFLTCDTREERIYILRMVGLWMKRDAAQVCTSEKLENMYPALYAYLQRMPEEIEDVYSDYMSDYKAYKLSNTLPTSDEVHFRGIEADTLPFRYSVLQENVTKDSIVIWVDAMGFEYLSLLKWALEGEACGTIKAVEIAQAMLPTETKFNEQWNQMSCPHVKKDKIDKLAHKGVIDEPDYYSCIEEQLSFFDALRKTICELFKRYRRVIITGDHGTSRLAARFFHEREGLMTPKGATALSHGRYCQLSDDAQMIYDTLLPVSDGAGNRYFVFKTYDHFKKSGFATSADEENIVYGEIHGGATPEEMIVPVVVFDSNSELPLTAKWKRTKVSLKKKVAKVELNFSRSIGSLQVKLGGVVAKCESEDGTTWTITAAGVAPNQYMVYVVADGQMIDVEPLTIKPALGEDIL